MQHLTRFYCVFVIVVLAVFSNARMARAEFAVCNQSFDLVNVAVGFLNRGEFRTRGWWRIGPNQCANVIREPLDTRFIYVFARDVFGKELLNGSVPMCIAPDRFVIDGEADCMIRGYLEAPFIEVDTQETDSWTLFLTGRPE